MPMHNGFLPREGFKLDSIIKLIRLTALNPLFMALPVLLSRFTSSGQKQAILHPTAVSRAKILLYIGIARWISGYMSKRAVNNWTTDTYDWQGSEIVLVTGGSSGIGAKVVEFLSELGIKVVILDIQEPMSKIGKSQLKDTSSKCADLILVDIASNVHFFKCDVTSRREIFTVAQQIRAQVGEPTILVNNAGVARGKTILDSTERDIRFTFDVNTLAHYWLVQEFLPFMIKKNHGMVVTVASIASWIAGKIPSSPQTPPPFYIH